MNNNVIVNADTDSIMIARPDGSPWTKEQQKAFIDDLNAQFPEKISFAHDGYFDAVLVMASKNYALLLNKDFCKPKDLDSEGNPKLKTKGSSIRDQKKEPALREMMDKIIAALIYDRKETINDIYTSYVKEVVSPITDIKRWCQKKSLSESILDCKGYVESDIKKGGLRRNETNVWDAIKDEEGMQQGDKFYLYPVILGNSVESGRVGKNGKPLKDKITPITGLKLDKYWTNNHDCDKLVERCYKTLSIFKLVLNMDEYIDYSKAKNQVLLDALRPKKKPEVETK